MNEGTFGKGSRHAPLTCVLCGTRITDFGHNPAPLRASGRCCGICNQDKVIPARLAGMGRRAK